jgi:putative hydrolase of the HAD superfamily
MRSEGAGPAGTPGSHLAIDAVLLDVGGVFLSPSHDLIRPAILAGGGDGSPSTLDRAHYAGIAELDAVGGSEWSAYHRGVASEAGVSPSNIPGVVATLREVLRSAGVWRRMVPGALEGLRCLAETGVLLGVVSNSDGTVEAQLLASQICQVGEGDGVPVVVVVDSAIAGFEKPDARIFAGALERLGVPPDRVAHVGDTVYADVRGALAAGVRPLHLDPHGFCRSGPAHQHVRSLFDVADLIAAGRSRPAPGR